MLISANDPNGISTPSVINAQEVVSRGYVLAGDNVVNFNTILFVAEDYSKARRYTSNPIAPEGGGEKYDAASAMPDGLTYEDIGIGVLVGWGEYAATDYGVLGLDKKVQLESCWLTQSGDDTLLHMAVKNVDAAPNTSYGVNVIIYE